MESDSSGGYHAKIVNQLLKEIRDLQFAPPVTHVYNPLSYARQAYDRYLELYGRGPKEIVMVGMNPGPWGMAQTGVPFGEVAAVTEWLAIRTPVGKPSPEHSKRPVAGFACTRSEVSGKRVWGWARNRFEKPEQFFKRFFIINYCPLIFLEKSGRNRTPNRLPVSERAPLMEACDKALRQTISLLKPKIVLGIGTFAAQRAETALNGFDLTISRISHPSPANPKANQGWDRLVTAELAELGITW
jgi:single-strand selective monofunctional uracil DNA glycosylase